MQVDPHKQVIVYKAAEAKVLTFGLQDIAIFRELLFTLIKRDLRGLYQQSLLGLFWRFFPALFTTAGYSVIFGVFGRVQLDGQWPYFMVLYCGLLPWTIFSGSLTAVVASVMSNAALIKKVYFPRLIAPLTSVVDKLLDVGTGFVILIGLMIYVGAPLGGNLMMALVYVCWAVVLAFAIGLWLAWTNVLFRDISHALPLVLQAMFYLSPIVYPSMAIPEAFRWIYQLNPMVPIIDGMRWWLLDIGHAPGMETYIAMAQTVVLLGGGLWFFQRVEYALADIL